jgi:hypothetical protein
VKAVKAEAPEMPIIGICPTDQQLKLVDHVVHSHHPQDLLNLVQRLFGDPRRGTDTTQRPVT